MSVAAARKTEEEVWIAERYVAESVNKKNEDANKILYNITKPEVFCSTQWITENLVRDGEIMKSEHSIQIRYVNKIHFTVFIWHKLFPPKGGKLTYYPSSRAIDPFIVIVTYVL